MAQQRYTSFKINGVEIKTPSEFDMSYYSLTESLRTADGDMQMEFVANKRRFNFSYNAISGRELNKIIDECWTKVASTRQMFHTLTFLDEGTTVTATVYAGAIPKKLHRADEGEWIWKDVKFGLIEK